MIYSKEDAENLKQWKAEMNFEKQQKKEKKKMRKKDIQTHDDIFQETNNIKVIATVNKKWFLDCTGSYSLVKEGYFFKKKIKDNPKFSFTAPWVKKTKIWYEEISFEMDKMTINVPSSNFLSSDGDVISNADMEFAPNISFWVSDVEKYYDKFCSSKGLGVITTSKEDFGLIYGELENILSNMVKEFKIDYVRGFNFKEVMHNIKEDDNNDIQSYMAKKLSLTFARMEENYGIRISDFKVNDPNKSKEFQKREDQLVLQSMENKANKEKADADRYVKEQQGLGEAAKLRYLKEALTDLPADKIAEVIRTLSLPEGTVNINGGSNQVDFLSALLALEQMKNNGNSIKK